MLNTDGDVDKEAFNKYNEQFKDLIADDLNTSNALTLVYDVLKSDINDKTKYELIKSFDDVLSLDLTKKDTIDSELKSYIEEKINERREAKNNKDYELADKIRNELLEKGIILKDTKDGTTYEINC